MPISCMLCDKEVTNGERDFRPTRTLYMCRRCGLIQLEEEAADDFAGERYSSNDKAAISITLRNEWEGGGRPSRGNQKLTLDDLNRIVSQFRPLDPIEKMDYALVNIEKASSYVGQRLSIMIDYDYPLY